MTLAEYFRRTGETHVEFAERTGLHRSEVWHFSKGTREPRAGKVDVIERATGGKVRAKDLAVR